MKPSSTLTSLPQPRAALGDISNSHRIGVQPGKNLNAGIVQKPVAQQAFLPSLHTTRMVEQVQQQPMMVHHQQQQPMSMAQHIDPMDTTLEDNIAEMTITPPSVSYSSSSASPHMPAVDESDKLNSQMCSEYAQEILAYWRASEMKRAPNPNYMTRQTDINPKMREILVDWMVEVQLKFKLKQETLFLSIHILDRFLERRAVTRNKLQLVGCTALLLAAKYEEIYAPEVQDFVCISDKAYTRDQILAMEGIMLNALGFNLTVPLPLNFLQRFARLAGVDQGSDTWYLAMYFAELTLQNYACLHFAPSQIAGAALYLAQTTTMHSANIWSAQQQSQMDYTPNQLAGCITELYKIVETHQNGTAKYKAVKKKYSNPKYLAVANYTCKVPQ